MKKEVYLTILFDYYSELLTNKKQEYFKLYYFDNLSLSEIAENLNISRNAVHKQLKQIENKLVFYEEKLKLIEKDNQIQQIIKNIQDKNIQDQLKKII